MHADKTKKYPASSHAAAPKPGGASARPLPDQRPQVKQLQAAQALANSGPQARQAAQLQAMADDFTTRRQPLQKNTTGLPDNLKAGLENLSGLSLDDVKVHRNSARPAQLQAHAYAQGSDIHLAPGQERHLPHEAWHVVQQKQGRVRPTMQLKGSAGVNDDAGLEQEADVMGARAMQFMRASPAHGATRDPVTRQARASGTTQYKRTEAGATLYTDRALDEPVATEKGNIAAPRIVMTFGNNVPQLAELIMENKGPAEVLLNPKYVIGVNVGPIDAKMPKGAKAPVMADAVNEAKELLSIGKRFGMAVIPFTWSMGANADEMYQFPYFEARNMLMKTASSMGESVVGTIYAMTDRDARASTGIDPESKVAKEIDKQLSGDHAALLSGPYNWREEKPGDARLDKTIAVVNRAETEFRHWKVQNNLYTYFPEPNMFFNQQGLNVAVKKLDGQNLAGKQAKESEAIRDASMQEIYSPDASVTKPAKIPTGKNPNPPYLLGVYELLKGVKKHTPVTAKDVQAMFSKIIQSELSLSNIKEMSGKNFEAALVKATEITEKAALEINEILKNTK